MRNISYGKERPLNDDSNEEEWRWNRRVHAVIGQSST
jgi:outer membrane protein OmpA-like peptidoglycan-associated protein